MTPRLLALGLAGALVAGLGTTASLSAVAAAEPVQLEAGTTPSTTVFPSDAFTVPDSAQVTGRRVALPTAGCGALGRSLCDDLTLINQLDGFDLQPRVVLPFTGDLDLLSITPTTVYVEDAAGVRTGLVQLVLDPVTDTVAGRTDAILLPATTYTLVVTNGVKAADGTPVVVGPGSERRVPFTTMSATNTLDRLRAALDDGSAYDAVGIAPAQRTLAFDAVAGRERSVFSTRSVRTVDRQDQTFVDPTQPKTAGAVLDPIRASAGFYGFGSIRSPQYTDATGVIAPFPSGTTPRPRTSAQVGVTMAAPTPSALPTASCLQPVVFGPGFTRSKYDVFLSGDTFPARGAALFATDPLGHAFGPQSTFSVTDLQGAVVTGKGFGRAADVDGDGRYSNSEGVGPTYSVKKDAGGQPIRNEQPGRSYADNTVPDEASKDAAVLLRDGLIQTVVDNMALVRALEKGVDVDGNGTTDTCTGKGAVAYFGQSFGGIYGTMLLGTDPNVTVGVPNVPGAGVVDIARESGFRLAAARTIEANEPDLRNAGPGLLGFTESIPLRLDPRNDRPAAGSLPIQELLARADWVSRAGDPSAYAHRLGTGGLFSAKKVIIQVAYVDGTVPNPTSGTLLRAGNLYDKAWIYRNDRTPSFQNNPHGFLLDPTIAGRNQAQDQIQQFVTSRGATEVDPDQGGPVWEKNPTLYKVQLDCLHYPDPQTGTPQSRVANAPDCVDRSGTLVSAAPTATPTATTSPTATASPTAAATAPTVSIRPGTITAKQSAQVTGTAQPGSTVELLAYSRPSTAYKTVRTDTVAADGTFAFTIRPSGNTRLFARVNGVDSPSAVLQVRTDLNLRVVRTGERTYRFSGSTLPKRRGQLVQVTYARPGGRTLAAKARVAADGTYVVTRTFTGTGTFTFSTITGTDNDNAAGTSNPVRTTVR